MMLPRWSHADVPGSIEVSGPDFTVTEDNLCTTPGSGPELQSLSYRQEADIW